MLQYGEIVDVRFPSLLYNTHRRFCYVQFADADQAAAATELDGKALAGNHRLVVKVSDPSIRHDRTGAVHEEREVYLGNLDWAASDQEIQDLLEQHGTPENVRIPRAVSGKTKGFAFASYHTKVL